MPSPVIIPLSSVGWLSMREVAHRLGYTTTAVQRWIRAGLIPVYTTPHDTVFLFRAADVADFTPPARGRPRKETKHCR